MAHLFKEKFRTIFSLFLNWLKILEYFVFLILRRRVLLLHRSEESPDAVPIKLLRANPLIPVPPLYLLMKCRPSHGTL